MKTKGQTIEQTHRQIIGWVPACNNVYIHMNIRACVFTNVHTDVGTDIHTDAWTPARTYTLLCVCMHANIHILKLAVTYKYVEVHV